MKESPKTIDEVRKLMGFPNYYRRYMEKFTRIAKPIHDLVKVVDPDETATKPYRNRRQQLPTNHPITWTSVLERLI